MTKAEFVRPIGTRKLGIQRLLERTKMKTSAYAFALLGALVPSGAHAAVAAVKVNCDGNCANVNLGQVCDTFVQFSAPTAVACELVAQPGAGNQVACGSALCRATGALTRGDLLSDYCDDTNGGQDAVVMCDDAP